MKNTQNYSEKKERKKYLFLFLALFALTMLLAVTLIAAFYSDMFVNSGRITAGTLKIDGVYTFLLNGEETGIDDIKNLNPGDIIVVNGTITNHGNKSAWIRDIISFTDAELFLPFVEVYNGAFTQAQLSSGDKSEYLLALSDNIAVSGNSVINGSGANAETDTGEDYNYLNDYSYQVTYTIYFLPSATNETQGQTFNLSVGIQALQFRNNNVAEPTEIAWSTVTPVQRTT